MPEITIALRVADDHRVTVATTMPQPQVGAPLCVTQSLALDAINAIKRNPRCAGVDWASSQPQTICRTLGVLRAVEEQAATPTNREFWAVIAPCGDGVFFKNKKDAAWTHTGHGSSGPGLSVPTLGQAFRNCYGKQPLELAKVQATTEPAELQEIAA